MPAGVHECTVCLKRFESHEKLREHTCAFQTEIATLLARLQALLVHQGAEAQHGGMTGRKSREVRDQSELSEEEQDSCPDMPIYCPDDDCARSEVTFKRPQDLTRHYGTHCECSEICQRCLVTFKKPSTFWAHKCATNARSAVDKEYFRMRTAALRRKVKRELAAVVKRNKRCPDALASDRLKRPKLDASTGSSGDAATGIIPEQAPDISEHVEVALSGDPLAQVTTPSLFQANPSQTVAPMVPMGFSTYQQQHQVPPWLGDEYGSSFLDGNIGSSTPTWLFSDVSADTPPASSGPDSQTVSELPFANYLFPFMD